MSGPLNIARRSAVLIVAALAFLQGCGCTTHPNRLLIGHRPHVVPPLQETHLRPAINPRLSAVDRALGFFTTPFKRAGVFGWRDLHIDAVVIGVVKQVATSTDHFVTADLHVSELTADGTPVDLQSERYLRAEICARRLRIPLPGLPCTGDKVRIAGALIWDSDGKGFLEIHPQRATGVEILERPGACR